MAENTGRSSNFIVTATRGARLKDSNAKNLLSHFRNGRITKRQLVERLDRLTGISKVVDGICHFCFNAGLGGTSCAHATA